jgi:hypothetical protein
VLRLSAFSLSKFVVGSSRANIPQFALKVSARAMRIIRDARTYGTINIQEYYKPLQHVTRILLEMIQHSCGHSLPFLYECNFFTFLTLPNTVFAPIMALTCNSKLSTDMFATKSLKKYTY